MFVGDIYKKRNGMMYTKNEIWKPVVGYEGYYECSNYGRIRGIERRVKRNNGGQTIQSSVVLKPQRSKPNAYLHVGLYRGDNKLKTMYVHRIIAEAFLVNSSAYSDVNHKNFDITDNRAENLEWCTHLYNMQYSNAHKRRHRSVVMIDYNGEPLRFYYSVKDVAGDGYRPSAVCQCCQGKQGSHLGTYWRYSD